jgi:hypothetical protein
VPLPKQSLQQPTDISEEKLEVAQQEGVDVEPVEGHSDEDDTDTKCEYYTQLKYVTFSK